MTDAAGESQLLSSSHQRAGRLRDIIAQHEAGLAADTLLDPEIRQAGLEAIRSAARCAARLAQKTGHPSAAAPFSTNDFLGEAQGDE